MKRVSQGIFGWLLKGAQDSKMCHAELVLTSDKSKSYRPLKQVQGDKSGYSAACQAVKSRGSKDLEKYQRKLSYGIFLANDSV